MKSEKGVTLLNVTMYLILLTLAIAALAVVRTHFHQNLSLITGKGIYASEFNKLNGFLVQDAKRNYNVGVESNRVDANASNPHAGTSEQKPVAAFKFGNGNVYIYYGNMQKGTEFGEKYRYLNQGIYKLTNQKRALKIAGGVTDMTVAVEQHGSKKRLVIGVEIGDGEIFTSMANPIKYTLKYW